MNKRILLDMDGVIADFIGAAISLHKPKDSTVVNWDFFEQWGLTASDFWTPMGYDFWLNIPKTIEAIRIVQMCEVAVGPKNVCLLTAPCKTKGCRDGKADWIDRHFPRYNDRHLIGAAKNFCSSPNSLLIDDSDKNCEEFVGAGGQVCLYPQPWNKARDNTHIAVQVLAKSLSNFIRDS